MSASQLDPLPHDLPFRIISKTIGRGAYASIKKAVPNGESAPVFAVKFIHKAYAVKHGRISAKQIAMEVSLHHHIGQHPNVIEWFATGEDAVWKWIAMEFAEGGDLFDKIEADFGVSEDIAHFYFTQLVGGVSYMHSKGVGHRDIKPENILLSQNGDLKIADFGLATLFEYQGKTKLSKTMCGSPPYIAPEVIACSAHSTDAQRGLGYAANMVDIWSCGIVLFVLLVGNTPWDEPTKDSWEFQEYTRAKGRSSDELWQKLPSAALSLLRGMINIDPEKRFSFEQIKTHPWYTRKNLLLSSDGRMTDQLTLATQMLQNLRIDFDHQPTASQRAPGQETMDIGADGGSKISFTQPEAPISDILFDSERPPLMRAYTLSAGQPNRFEDQGMTGAAGQGFDPLIDEPGMSQFTANPTVPLSLTQNARNFGDILPKYSLTRFFSHLAPQALLQLLSDALHRLNVLIPPISQLQIKSQTSWIKIRTKDGRQCALHGDIVVEPYITADGEFLEVRLVKVKGDPLEWRRFFKSVVVLCKEGVYVPTTPSY